MKTKESRWEFSKKITIFFQEYYPELSNPKGLITFVHGLGSHSGRYSHFTDFFTRNGYAMLGFDLPGHGKSDGVRGHAESYDQIAEIIQHFVDHASLEHPELPQFLYGHSMGGSLVLYFLMNRKHNLQAAIASSPGLSPAKTPGATKYFAAKVLSFLFPTFQIENDLDIPGLCRDVSIVQKYQQDPLVHSKISARLGFELVKNGSLILENANKISLPLLVMQGTADRLVDPLKNRQFAQRSNLMITYKEWQGFYHELHNEPEKDDVLNFLLNWINQRTVDHKNLTQPNASDKIEYRY